MLVVTVVAGQPIGPIVKGQEVQEDVLRLLDPRQPQKSEDLTATSSALPPRSQLTDHSYHSISSP
jgi:hypothetical protein